MDVCSSAVVSQNDISTFGRKSHLNTLKEVKRKLSFMNKKISDLHHQRKFAYKNSLKVKKMVHNQVNQIVKCLRIRERSLWSDVDESYILQDAKNSDELSRLQSAHARCQVLLNHLDDFRESRNVLSKIYSILAEVNFGEKSDIKSLEFVSNFEAMKSRASNYGHLETDFFKKDDFVFIADKKDSNLAEDKFCDEVVPVFNTAYAPCKEDDLEDSFQIIDLLDNMCCHDATEDMYEEKSLNCNGQTEKEFIGTPAHKFAKVCESSKYSCSSLSNRDVSSNEELKQVLEMDKKIADLKKKLKYNEEVHIKHNALDKHMIIDKLNKQDRFVLFKEADNWLYNLNSKKDVAREKIYENANLEINSASPAELIRKAFKPYLKKDVAKNWLLCN